jgi:hypothetical protein
MVMIPCDLQSRIAGKIAQAFPVSTESASSYAAGFLVASSTPCSLLKHGVAFSVGLAGLSDIAQTVRAATANQLGATNLRWKGELAKKQAIRLPDGDPALGAFSLCTGEDVVSRLVREEWEPRRC